MGEQCMVSRRGACAVEPLEAQLLPACSSVLPFGRLRRMISWLLNSLKYLGAMNLFPRVQKKGAPSWMSVVELQFTSKKRWSDR